MEVAGPYQLHVLQPVVLRDTPTQMWSFARKSQAKHAQCSLVHGYLEDSVLMGLANNPARQLAAFADFLAVVTPDFSMTLGMPLHDRVRSAWMGRAAGAFFQSRGLPVIPNIRWAEMSDLDVVLDGTPCQGTIALSSQGLVRDKGLHSTFQQGVSLVLERLAPRQVVFYGPISRSLYEMITDMAEIFPFPTDIRRIYDERAA